MSRQHMLTEENSDTKLLVTPGPLITSDAVRNAYLFTRQHSLIHVCTHIYTRMHSHETTLVTITQQITTYQ